jgi:hypothetical protein
MDQGQAPDTAMWSLRSRGPAHAVIHRCLDAQRTAPPRGRLWRTFGGDPVQPAAAKWYHEAIGELRVAEVLGQLGEGWHVVHAVPHSSADAEIDHVLVGPPGVLTLAVEHRAGRRIQVSGSVLYVDGHRTAALPAVDHQARLVSRVLSRAVGIPVVATPLVVVVDAVRITRGALRSPAAVVDARELVAHLRAQPTRLPADLVRTIARAAEEWTTWRPFGHDAMTHRDPGHAFAQLRDEVARARGRRRLWGVAGVAALAVTAFGAASGLFS